METIKSLKIKENDITFLPKKLVLFYYTMEFKQNDKIN